MTSKEKTKNKTGKYPGADWNFGPAWENTFLPAHYLLGDWGQLGSVPY